MGTPIGPPSSEPQRLGGATPYLSGALSSFLTIFRWFQRCPLFGVSLPPSMDGSGILAAIEAEKVRVPLRTFSDIYLHNLRGKGSTGRGGPNALDALPSARPLIFTSSSLAMLAEEDHHRHVKSLLKFRAALQVILVNEVVRRGATYLFM